jgi:hypothetical protein
MTGWTKQKEGNYVYCTPKANQGQAGALTTHRIEHNPLSTLYLAFELGNKQWKLDFTIGLGQRPRERAIVAGDLVALQEEIRLAKKRFGLSETARVMSCYEAGRDGFWLHRYLVSKGIENLVVDSASIEVNRRAKRAKTDRLDVRSVWIDPDPLSKRG